MKLPPNVCFAPNGHLKISGCDAVKLAKTYGTPLYVMDEDLIRQRCQEYKAGLSQRYPNSEVIFAGKAFMTLAMCKLLEQEGLGIDVVSGGEVYTAITANFPAGRLYFQGNNKSPEEIRLGFSVGVGRFVVDNFLELEILEKLARKHKSKARVLLRVTPGVEAHTHEYITTGKIDSKFGFPIDTGQAMEVVRQSLSSKNIELKGLHCHIGSQIFDLTPFRITAEKMLRFMDAIRRETGITLEELDLGGGLGIRYLQEDNPPSIAEYLDVITTAVKEETARLDYPLPKLIIEPGRSIVGDAGITLYTVGAVKEIPGVRTYVLADGGMADNPRPSLYGSRYEAVLANRINKEPTRIVTIGGKCCESGDVLISDINLPLPKTGDILAILSTGAYHYSMASNYNRLPRPATVFVSKGKSDLVISRERYEDLVLKDVIPERLRTSEYLNNVGLAAENLQL